MKSEITISLLTSVLITFLALLLLFSFIISLTKKPESVYCSTFNKLRMAIGDSSEVGDPVCNKKSLGLSKVALQQEILTKFQNGMETVAISFDEPEKSMTFAIPSNSQLLSVTAAFKFANSSGSVNSITLRALGSDLEIPCSDSFYNVVDLTSLFPKETEESTHYLRNLPLTLTSEPGSIVLVDSLKIQYLYCPIEQALFFASKDCLGESEGLCFEAVIPSECNIKVEVSEKIFTEFLLEKNLCFELPNSDFGCGNRDSFDLLGELKSPANVLIEKQNGKIKIS